MINTSLQIRWQGVEWQLVNQLTISQLIIMKKDVALLTKALHATVLHQLHQTTRLLTKQLNSLLEPFGIYASEWPILLLLQQGPLTQVELSDLLHIEPPAVSKTLFNLEKKGLILRITGQDRRQKQSLLTPQGRQLYESCRQQLEAERQQLGEFLAPEEDRQLLFLLEKIQSGAVPKVLSMSKESSI